MYCMLPWHQRTSRWANSSMVGGFSSQLPRSSRQHAHLVAGAAHQRGLDLVVRQHVAAERRLARQHRQLAVLVERRDAHQRVVAPERTAVADPPGLAHGVGAHAVAHAELEDAGEARWTTACPPPGSAGCRSCGWACIMRMRRTISAPAIRLSASSGSISVEVAAPALAEVAHVAGLEAGVLLAPAVDDAVAVRIGRLPGLDRLLLGGGHRRIVGVAQHEIAEGAALAGGVDAGLDGLAGAGWRAPGPRCAPS